jgi:hypothetical protein
VTSESTDTRGQGAHQPVLVVVECPEGCLQVWVRRVLPSLVPFITAVFVVWGGGSGSQGLVHAWQVLC